MEATTNSAPPGMGWFAFLAVRDAAHRRALEEAATATPGDAWERVGDRAFVEALFARRASEEPAVALAMARLGRDEESRRILLEEGVGEIGPLVLARLKSDRARSSLALLLRGVDLGRPLGDHVADEEQRLKLWATSPHQADRDRAFAAMDDVEPLVQLSIAGRAATQGDDRGAEVLVQALARLRSAVDQQGARAFGAKVEELPPEDVQVFLLRAFTHLQVGGSAEHLVGLLRTQRAMLALDAIAFQADPAVLPALEAYRRSLVGDPDTTAPLQVWADVALHACGAPIELAAAETIRAMHPVRYGYPKREHLAALHAAAARLFLAAGVHEDWVASLIRSDFHVARQVGLQASPGPLDHWDEARGKVAAPDELWAALEADRTVWRYRVVEALWEREIDDDRLVAWCRAHLEAVDNFPVAYADDAGHTGRWALRVLKNCPDAHPGLQDTTSAWIRSFVLNDGHTTRPDEVPEPPAGVTVERIDRIPFRLGHTVNALALSPDGTRLAAVGEEFMRVLDTRTGTPVTEFELRFRWAYEVVWSPDGRRIAAAFHGGHVAIFDAGTGAQLHHLRGHSGVPHGARSLCWAGDLLISGGEGGLLIGWDVDTGERRWTVGPVPGSWQRIVVDAHGGVASHLKTEGGETNFLFTFDPATGEGKQEETATSMWALARREDGLLALAGEGKGITLRKPGETDPWRRLGVETHKRIVRVLFRSDGLHAITDDGRWTRFDLDTGTETPIVEAGAPLWALTGNDVAAFAAGKDGIVHRLGADGGLLRTAGVSHVKDVRGLANGVSLDWNGNLLRWPAEGGEGEVIASLGVTPESLVALDDGYLVGSRQGIFRLDVEGRVVARTEERTDHVAVVGDRVVYQQGKAIAFADLATLATIGEPIPCGTADVNALASFGDGVLVGNEDGQVAWVVDGQRVWEAWEHGSDRLEEGNPHANCCSIVAAGHRFATGATDRIVRVYELRDGTPQLRWRIASHFGLFNRLAMDPTARWLAVPNGGRLMLWDIDVGTERWCLWRPSFEGEELTLVHWDEDGSLMVGSRAGRLFRVRWT